MDRAVAREVARTGLLGVAATMIFVLPASAQQLWRVEEVTRPIPSIAVGGVAAVPQAASAGGRLTAEAATVQVEFDYLRLGMGYLELPLWDGSVIEAENAVFEDRGDGNLMWTGEVPGRRLRERLVHGTERATGRMVRRTRRAEVHRQGGPGREGDAGEGRRADRRLVRCWVGGT